MRQLTNDKQAKGSLLANIDDDILTAARAGMDQTVVIAAAVLRHPDMPDRVTYSSQEFGDGEAVLHMRDFVRSCKRQKLLKPGESLHVEVRRIEWQEMRPE